VLNAGGDRNALRHRARQHPVGGIIPEGAAGLPPSQTRFFAPASLYAKNRFPLLCAML
jgi:hypothetical protein